MYYFKKTDNENINIGSNSKCVPSDCIEITKAEYDELFAELIAKAEAEREEPNNEYGIPNDVYDSIIDEYTLMLIEEGVIE